MCLTATTHHWFHGSVMKKTNNKILYMRFRCVPTPVGRMMAGSRIVQYWTVAAKSRTSPRRFLRRSVPEWYREISSFSVRNSRKSPSGKERGSSNADARKARRRNDIKRPKSFRDATTCCVPLPLRLELALKGLSSHVPTPTPPPRGVPIVL